MNPPRRARLVVAMLGATLALLTQATPAMAEQEVTPYVNVQTGRCLDSAYNGDIYTLGCNGGAYQIWASNFIYGNTTVIDVQTGRCLDSDYYGRVYTLPCNLGNFQKWHRSPDGRQIINNQTGRCLDSAYNGDVYTLACNGGDYQNWTPISW